MLILSVSTMAGVSAAFACWLCCVAYSDCFLALFTSAAAEISRLEAGHEHRA